MNQSISQRALANVCLFCNETLPSPNLCRFCGFKFCETHLDTENHQCIKTRYFEYIKNTGRQPNVASGKFRVVCNVCGFVSKKPTPIEYAGEELTQHMQIIGCSKNIFLEEITQTTEFDNQVKVPPPTQEDKLTGSDITEDSTESSVVEQILKLAKLKEQNMITDTEFSFIKRELIKKLKK